MPRSRSKSPKRPSVNSPEMKKIFDANYAKRMAKGYDLKVTLKKNFKGYSLFAKKHIRKGNVVAYYKFLVNRYKNYTGYKNDMYAMSVYNKNDRFNPHVIGDIYEGSLEPPKRGIPFWAYFSNEPSGKQRENCMLDINLKGNYRNRDKVKPGDTMVYKLVATKDIKPGEELSWCYSGSYQRDYPANCED